MSHVPRLEDDLQQKISRGRTRANTLSNQATLTQRQLPSLGAKPTNLQADLDEPLPDWRVRVDSCLFSYLLLNLCISNSHLAPSMSVN